VQAAVAPGRGGRQAHHLLADEVDRPVVHRLAQRRGVGGRQVGQQARAVGQRRVGAAVEGGGDRQGVGAGLHRRRSLGWPHHQVAILGSFSRSPSSRRLSAGRKLSRARASITPDPGVLETTTPPARIASSRPGTPRREALFSSSGSMKSASTRRQMTSARLRPAMVRT
jgi:hypothetical protein